MQRKELLSLSFREWAGAACAASLLVLVLLVATEGKLGGPAQTAEGYTAANTSSTTNYYLQVNANPNPPLYYVAPPVPSFFYAASGGCGTGRIVLTWAETAGVTEYKLKRGDMLVYQGLSTSYTDANLESGRMYNYSLYSLSVSGGTNLEPLRRSKEAPGDCATDEPMGSDPGPEDGDAGGGGDGTTTDTASTSTLWTDIATDAVRTPILVLPSTASLYPGQTLQFSVGPGPSYEDFQWKTQDNGGLITDDGLYTAPSKPGAYRIVAKTRSFGRFENGYATVQVLSAPAASEATPTETTVTGTAPTGATTPAPVTAPAPVVSTAPQPAREPRPTPAPLLNPPIDREENEVMPTRTFVAERPAPAPRQEATHAPLPEQARANADKLRSVANLIDARTTSLRAARADLLQLIDAYAGDGAGASNDTERERIRAAKAEAEEIVAEGFRGADVDAAGLDRVARGVASTLEDAGLLPEGEGEKLAAVTNALADTLAAQDETLNAEGAGLLYKDSNRDGISDYESERVYDIDPEAPAVLSEYEGRRIGAAEKLLLGFDPTKEELVRIVPEEPEAAEVAPTEGYKVVGVSLTDEKKVAIAGRALPNSFVTIYIYSTPVVVTVKSDEDGVWSYTLDTELDDGSHTVYTATVNQSGKILARSQGYLFTKTAQAATLDAVVADSGAYGAPRLLAAENLYLIVGALAGIFLIMFGILGLRPRQDDGVPPPAAA